MKNSRYLKWCFFLLVVFILLLGAVVLSLSVGDMKISFSDIIRLLKTKEGIEYAVLVNLRLPRTILAFAVGGALSLSGTLLQGVYRNPLVEPYTMGISGGAAFGVAICIVTGLYLKAGAIALPVVGFAGALLTVFFVYFLSIKRQGGLSIHRMLLTGVMISFIASSAMMFLMSITSAEDVHGIIFWIMGSLSEPNAGLIKIAVVVAFAGLISSYFFVIQLNALRLGETKAQHLGINTSVTIRVIFVIASLITGISVSVAGVIGFVGLVVPHLIRYIVGSDFRISLIGSFLVGSIFLIFCDVLARTLIAPNELPIGVITGIAGGVMFIIALSSNFSNAKSLR